jgi:aspartate/tyrosine/aromatic aminotransferase
LLNAHHLHPFVKTQAYNSDDFPDKVNVGVGAYRCDQGMPFVLPVVMEAEKAIIAEEMDHEYSGIVSVGFLIKIVYAMHYFSQF